MLLLVVVALVQLLLLIFKDGVDDDDERQHHQYVALKNITKEKIKRMQYSGVSIWNNLPVHVQHSPSVNVFKARYLKWVQNQGIPE